ncbi:MAG: glycosyltransferase [Gemmobacter sp.]
MTRIHGYIRFSYLGRSDARASRNGMSDAERAAVIYAPLRMAQRFHLFEHVCLPSLRAQTHADFRIVLLASPEMPEADRHRLQALAATLPQAEVLYSQADSVVEALNPVITDLTARAKGMTYHFRLDDDDALCTTAIATMDRYCDLAVPDELLTMPRGFTLVRDGEAVHLLRRHEDFVSAGLGFFTAPGTLRNPYSGSHRKIYRHVPTRMEPRLPAYIHVDHVAADTAGAAARKMKAALRDDPDHAKEQKAIGRQMEKHFPFKARHLRWTMQNLPVDAPLAPDAASG